MVAIESPLPAKACLGTSASRISQVRLECLHWIECSRSFNPSKALSKGTSRMTLSTVVIAFESEEAARRRLEGFGYAADVAAEIAVYLAQSTDLPQFRRRYRRRARRGWRFRAEFVPLDELPARLRKLAPRRDETIVWALTDGVRFYRGAVGSGPGPSRRLRPIWQSGDGGPSRAGQVREPRARLRRRTRRPADAADRGRD